jgi:hypothetical protein
MEQSASFDPGYLVRTWGTVVSSAFRQLGEVPFDQLTIDGTLPFDEDIYIPDEFFRRDPGTINLLWSAGRCLPLGGALRVLTTKDCICGPRLADTIINMTLASCIMSSLEELNIQTTELPPYEGFSKV